VYLYICNYFSGKLYDFLVTLYSVVALPLHSAPVAGHAWALFHAGFVLLFQPNIKVHLLFFTGFTMLGVSHSVSVDFHHSDTVFLHVIVCWSCHFKCVFLWITFYICCNCLCAWNNFRNAEQVGMKFGIVEFY